MLTRKGTQSRHSQAEAVSGKRTTYGLCEILKATFAFGEIVGRTNGSVDLEVVLETKEDPDGDDGACVVPVAGRVGDELVNEPGPLLEARVHNCLLLATPAVDQFEDLVLLDAGGVPLKLQEGNDHGPSQAEHAELGGVVEADVGSQLLLVFLDRNEGVGVVRVPGSLGVAGYRGMRGSARLMRCQYFLFVRVEAVMFGILR